MGECNGLSYKWKHKKNGKQEGDKNSTLVPALGLLKQIFIKNLNRKRIEGEVDQEGDEGM